MKLAICQLNSTVGNFSENLDTIEEVVENLNYSRADIFVFPELFVTGYPPRDLLDHQWFIQQGASALDRLKQLSLSIPEKAIITGMVLPIDDESGHSLYNAAIVVSNGELIFSQGKTLLPTYDVFDEHRYFRAAEKRELFTFKGKHIGLAICEDMWNTCEGTQDRRHNQNPIDELAQMGAQLLITIAASPFHQDKQRERYKLIETHAKSHNLPFLFVNSVGANDELIFDGGSLYINSQCERLCELPHFTEAIEIIDTDNPDDPLPPIRLDQTEAVLSALVLGIKDYFYKCNYSQALLSLSGGIDSAVAATIAVEALGAENVTALILPSEFSSMEALRDAKLLAANLGITCEEISIAELFSNFLHTLSPQLQETDFGVAEENLQARIRGTLLMTLANKYGKLLLNSGNKSEMAVGYCTLYGDISGALSVLGDIYKSDVYRLAYFINRSGETIPVSIINRAPSPELRPNQKDEDTLPPYDELDAILRSLLEEDKSSEEIVESGFKADVVQWIVNAIKTNEFKRRQMAPILKVTPKAFGMGRRFPIAASYEW